MNFHNLWLYIIEIFEGTKKHEDIDILLVSDQIWVLGFSLIGCLSQLKLIKVEKTCRVYTSLKSTLQNTNRPWRVTWIFSCLLKTIWNASWSSFLDSVQILKAMQKYAWTASEVPQLQQLATSPQSINRSHFYLRSHLFQILFWNLRLSESVEWQN